MHEKPIQFKSISSDLNNLPYANVKAGAKRELMFDHDLKMPCNIITLKAGVLKSRLIRSVFISMGQTRWIS